MISLRKPAVIYLGSNCGANSKGKQFCGRVATIQRKFSKSSSVPFDRLADTALLGVELHRASNASLLKENMKSDKLLLVLVLCIKSLLLHNPVRHNRLRLTLDEIPTRTIHFSSELMR